MAPGDRHVVAFNLARKPVDIRACYILDGVRSDYRRFGAVSYLPAGVGMHAVGREAGARMLMCRYDNAPRGPLFEKGDGIDLDRLARCVDIRNRDIVRALERIAEETRNPGSASGALISAIATALAIDLVRLTASDAAGALSEELLLLVESYCMEHIAEKPGLPEVAVLCGLSPRQLAAALKRTTGLGFSQYLASLRFRQARQLLLDTMLPIKEVAYRCGFSHVTSFTNAFREAVGMTPARYRTRRTH
ncbi:helix-turn-helix transcriptional regulator [Croceicoccus estronivorus]|uniref:helix-turn-helix transcriptional regulator n=1 Tax=Croceicoccus estronivorus TaxID=1172626 RepID=UPI0012E95974|nr:helix-turn-helix transcriptional regulator [Croceicoccus estronivorus]